MTIWAGGHVRRSDSPNRTGAISAGAIRELEEELRLYVTKESLKLLGAVYVQDGQSTQQHVAFVYEWRAPTDDVEIALCNSEFIERRGNSLQGTFLPVEKIAEEGCELEDWSSAIVTHLLDDQTTAARI